MMRGGCCLVVIAAFALAACTSPPLVWHTLVKPRGEPSAARTVAKPGVDHVFEFALPGVPAQVDRAELVLVDDASRPAPGRPKAGEPPRGEANEVSKGARQVRVLEGERWLAPLPEEVRAALSRGYARASGAREATGLPRPQGVSLLRVRTMLRRFEIGDGRAALEAQWSLQFESGAARDVPLCSWSARATASGADASTPPDAGVSAMQDLLDALASTIALMASAWIADAATPCPAAAGVIATPRG